MKKSKHEKWVWWKHGVIYHIYPRSFYDSNNDGIGDLKGILKKLPYLQSLGIDAIWLSPIFESPQVDFGYDVSDYMKIDKIFGSLKDFKALLKGAHKKNINVILDLILNHTSDQHEWFKESKSSIDNPKRDWYIWHDGKNNKAPNNWKTCFGKSAWEYDPVSKQYYYHSFFKEQPDLNWRNKDLAKEFFEIIRYWLDTGVDGFRLDVANLIIKDKKLRNNPGILKMQVNKKIYTRNRPRSHKTLKKFRKILDKYEDRMSVGEIYTIPPGSAELSSSYMGNGNNMLHMTFDFSLIFTRWNASKYLNTIDKWMKAIPDKGWPCHVLSNHDLLRDINRHKWRIFKKQKALVSAFLLLTFKGTPFIYYGEEIGMQNTRIRKRKIMDPLGKRFWPFFGGRDKARTPMQWNSARYAGFSKTKPWLPIHKYYKKFNIEKQLKTKYSSLWYYKNLIHLRKKHSALLNGEWLPVIKGENGILAYLRINKSESILIVLNFKPFKNSIITDLNKTGKILLSTNKYKKEVVDTGKFTLEPFEATIVQLNNIN